jgi:GxxExxY protein
LERQEEVAALIVNAAYRVHKILGPGLLERIYETCLVHELEKASLMVERQVVVPIDYDGLLFKEGFRLDLLVEKQIIVELKAVEQMNALWEAQILSYLRLTKLHIGFLINFNVPLIKQGIRRYRI